MFDNWLRARLAVLAGSATCNGGGQADIELDGSLTSSKGNSDLGPTQGTSIACDGRPHFWSGSVVAIMATVPSDALGTVGINLRKGSTTIASTVAKVEGPH
jgi:hypothetical protein